MFDIGAAELLVIVVVAIVVIGPKELPLALRTAGRWIGKIRRVSNHFRTGLDAMIREAELEEMDRKWKEQNERIMPKYPSDEGIAEPAPMMEALPPGTTDPDALRMPPAAHDEPAEENAVASADEPSLPFDRPADAGKPAGEG